MVTLPGKTHNAKAFFGNDRYLMEKHLANELLAFITKYVNRTPRERNI